MGAGIEESTEDAARWLGGEGGGRPADTMDRIEEILASGGPIPVDAVTRPHALVVAAWRVVATPNGRAQERLAVVFVPAEVWDRARDLLVPLAERLAAGAALLVLIGRPNDPSIAKAASRGLAAVLPHDAGADDVTIAAHHAFELLENKGRAEARGRWLRRYRYELGELIHIARAMTTVRDVDQLLGVILEKSRFVTGADAGSIYIVDAPSTTPVLRFKLTQNDSVSFDSREFTIPVSDRSIAGCAALRKATLNIPDVYDLPAGSTFHFDPSSTGARAT